MADDSRDDADNEITRIVRRPGPAQLPINVMRPPNAAPPIGMDAAASVPPPAAAANDSAPPVAPPAAFDRPRPVMTPPPRPSMPPMGAIPLPPVPPSVVPTPVAPAPVVLRPTPPVPVETRIAPIPAPIASPAPTPTPVGVDAAQPVTPSIAAAIAVPAVTPVVVGPAAGAVVAPAPAEPVVGWFVVIKGPGRGTAREIVTGRNGIGSASGQAIKLDFGDPAIAPQGHAYMVYDDEARAFFVEDGKQKIVVRLNGKLLTETMPISHGDELRIGATTLRFVALCGPDFDWNEKDEKAAEVVSDVVAKAEGDENNATGEG